MLKDVSESFAEPLLEKVKKKSACSLTYAKKGVKNYKLTELSSSGG